MDLTTITDFLARLSLLHWLLIVFLPGAAAFSVYFWKYLKAQFRFGKNLRRSIYFLKTSEDKKLTAEKNTLAQPGLFKLVEDIKDISKNLKELSLFSRHAVYIVGYDSRYNGYKELINIARVNNIPIILLARPGEIQKNEHWDIINGYIYCDVANSTNRVGIVLMGMMQIVPGHPAG